MALKQRRKTAATASEQPEDEAKDTAQASLPRARTSSSLPRILLLLVITAVAALAGAHHLQLVDVPALQQLGGLLGPWQEQLSPILQKLSAHVSSSQSSSGSGSSGSSSGGSGSSDGSADRMFTREELSLFSGGKEPHHKQDEIYIAILGQVFDVSSNPKFYGPGQGYGHFAGTDGSKSFITGDFVGDVTDDVSSLDGEACLGLVGWLDFYHKTYIYKGKLIGAFYDAKGKPTPALESVHARAKEGEAARAARKEEEANWPSCNSKWTEEEGGTVWCDPGMYPRKLFDSMQNGRANWRCACFKELGWSDVRKVYAGCSPDANLCSTDDEVDSDDDLAAELEGLVS